MRSQSLFNFFTKSAVTVHSGPTAAKDYIKKQQQHAGGRSSQGSVSPMSDQQRWASDLDYSLRNHGSSVRDAYSHFDTTMTERYGNKDPRYTAAMAYAKKRLATDQFNRMWDNYHAYTDPGMHPNDAMADSRMNSRMIIGDAEQAGYIFTPNENDSGWNPGNLTYSQFKNFFTDPTTGQMMSKDAALAKWTNAWETRDAADSRGRNSNTSVGARRPAAGGVRRPAGGSVPGSGSPQDDSWRDIGRQQENAALTAYANNKAAVGAGTPLTFQGGHTVNYDPRYVKNWTRYTRDNPANNNIGGTWYNDEQYLSYRDISDQLYKSMTERGMDPNKAKAEASRLTKAYLDDQMEIARGGTARNNWMEQPAAPTSVDTTDKTNVTTGTVTSAQTGAPTDVTKGQPVMPGDISLGGGHLPGVGGTPSVLGGGSSDNGVIALDYNANNANNVVLPDGRLQVDSGSNPDVRLITPGSTLDSLNLGANSTVDGSTSANASPTVLSHIESPHIRLNSEGQLEQYSPENKGMDFNIDPAKPNFGLSSIPSGYSANTGGNLVLGGSGVDTGGGSVLGGSYNPALTPTVEGKGEGKGKQVNYNAAPIAPTESVTLNDVNQGRATVDQYLDKHTTKHDLNAMLKGNPNLTVQDYYNNMAARHYNNMASLVGLLQNGNLNGDDRARVIAAAKEQALRFNSYAKTVNEDKKLFAGGRLMDAEAQEMARRKENEFIPRLLANPSNNWFTDDYYYVDPSFREILGVD